MMDETQTPLERFIAEAKDLATRTGELEFKFRNYYTQDVDILDREAHRKLSLARELLHDINQSLMDCAEYMEEAKQLEDESNAKTH